MTAVLDKALPRKTGFLYGAITGILLIMLSLVLYLINPGSLMGWWAFLGYLIIVVAMFIAVMYVRRQQNSYITFFQGFQTAFFINVTAMVMWVAFNYLLFTVIDPSIAEATKEQAIERTISMMEAFGSPADEVDKAVERLEDADFTPTIGKTLINFASSVLVGTFWVLLIAGFMHLISRKNKPEEPAFTTDTLDEPER